MDISERIRQQAKMDSRRFGKGVVCRIVIGPLLSVSEQHGLVPRGVYINPETGLDPINNKMLVIPVTKYEEVNSLVKNYQNSVSQRQQKLDDIENIEKVARSDEALVKALQQNLVLVTVNHNVPDGIRAGAPPEAYDVIIDSIDVNQVIEATYVYRSRANIRTEETIR